MNLYDPNWHRFEPTQDEVLADVRREELESRTAEGLQRVVKALPWPIRVVLPFMALLMLPIMGLALVFGVFATHPVDLFEQLQLERIQATTVIRGDLHLRVDSSMFVLVADGTPHSLLLENVGDLPLEVRVRILGPPIAGTFTVRPDNVVLKPGGAANIEVSCITDSTYFANATFFVTAELTAEPRPP